MYVTDAAIVASDKLLTWIIDDQTAQEAVRLQNERLAALDQLAQQQLGYNDSLKSNSSLTVREVLEMERNGQLR